MPPLPKRKISKRRTGKRRAAINLKAVNMAKCPHCGQLKTPHTLCPNCKQY